MKLENFAILIRTDGVTGQLVLTAAEQRLFSQIVIGALTDTYGQAGFVTTPTIYLPPDLKAFPQNN